MTSMRGKQQCLSHLHILYLKGPFIMEWYLLRCLFALFQTMWMSRSRSDHLHVVVVDVFALWIWTGWISKRAGKASSAVAVGQFFVSWQANPLLVCVYVCAAWAWSVIRRGGGLRAAACSPGAGSRSQGRCGVRSQGLAASVYCSVCAWVREVWKSC